MSLQDAWNFCKTLLLNNTQMNYQQAQLLSQALQVIEAAMFPQEKK